MRQAWYIIFSLVLIGLLFPPAAVAQGHSDWVISGGVDVHRVNDINGWGIGPVLHIERHLYRSLGVEASPVYLPSSSGYYTSQTIALDVGLWHRVVDSRVRLSLGAGGTGIIGGDSDGTPVGGGGGYVSAGANVWTTSNLGLASRSVVRLTNYGVNPSISVGLAVRF